MNRMDLHSTVHSTVFAVEEIADRIPAGCVGFAVTAERVGAPLRCGVVLFGAAGWAAVGKSWLSGTQLELLATDGADLNREGHNGFYFNGNDWCISTGAFRKLGVSISAMVAQRNVVAPLLFATKDGAG